MTSGMPETDPTGECNTIREAAQSNGLDVAWVVSRERIDPHFRNTPPTGTTPASLHPGFGSALVLGSAGRRYWELFRAGKKESPHSEDEPLDRFFEEAADRLLTRVRAYDPAAQSGYPFRHARQILPFLGMLKGLEFLCPSPLGISLDPVHGPWFAWRAVIFTARPSGLPRRLRRPAGLSGGCVLTLFQKAAGLSCRGRLTPIGPFPRLGCRRRGMMRHSTRLDLPPPGL